MNPEFLDTDDVLVIHAIQIERFGGDDGVRDIALLESAVAQPQATFEGQFVHGDIVEMAAAYLFHLVSNHPFVDGNKRVGLAAALVFLDLNGVAVSSGTELLYELTMSVARGELDKFITTTRLRSIVAAKDGK